MPFLTTYARPLVLLAVVAAGLLILSPFTNYQDFLSQGDHGRDLYAAQAVYRGELPYRDFWWVYGPLTPYYYGLFYKIFGVKITSVILGKLILRILGGVFVCLGMAVVTNLATGFFCACWFMLFQQDFFFTYNHIAGIAMVLGVAWCLLAYIKTNSAAAAWRALAFTFILCLIKVNFGIVALVMTMGTVAVCDWVGRLAARKSFYAAALVGLPLVVFLIYWALMHGLSSMEIRQCLPYKEGDQPYDTTIMQAVGSFLKITFNTIRSNWMNSTFALIINASALRCVYVLWTKKLAGPRRTMFLLALSMLTVFWVLNFHEYLKSGVWYRGFWAQPVSIMIIFLLIDTATQSFGTVARAPVRKGLFTLLTAAMLYAWIVSLGPINAAKVPGQLLDLPRGGVYLTNAPAWINTVEETTAFLEKTLKPNELFFALPYDCLYYYLTAKRTPTRQLIFFEHIKIPVTQEKSVIAELEKNRVNYVLVSSRAYARQELGLGFLGRTYCPLIGKYIKDNFVPIARFGDWQDEPGWAWNHGTLILKRK
jgi:hypothetical protein